MHVIYITGLGDEDPKWQLRVVTKTWQLYNVDPYFFRVGWADGTLGEKLERLDRVITNLHNKDRQPIGIVGISAGASLALHTFVARPDAIAGVVTVCGKILRPENVREETKRYSPAFAESMSRMPGTLDALTSELKRRILCVYPLADEVVAVQDQHIKDVYTRRVYSVGHGFSIATQLLFGARKNIHFLRRSAHVLT